MPRYFPREGGNPVVFAERIVDPKAKTVLVYGHYDVMPVDPVDEWRTSPFEPVVKDGRIWCRGADDDKGQLFMHAKAFEAICATDSLPYNSEIPCSKARKRSGRPASTSSAPTTRRCSRQTSFWFPIHR